jgi:hypothetical protein
MRVSKFVRSTSCACSANYGKGFRPSKDAHTTSGPSPGLCANSNLTTGTELIDANLVFTEGTRPISFASPHEPVTMRCARIHRVARASVASPTFFPPSCRHFRRYYLRKPDGILLLVDALWFGSLGYGDVFRKTLSIRWAIFAASFAATFFILYGWFLALRRAYQPDLLSSGIVYIARQPAKLPGERTLHLIALIVTYS